MSPGSSGEGVLALQSLSTPLTRAGAAPGQVEAGPTNASLAPHRVTLRAGHCACPSAGLQCSARCGQVHLPPHRHPESSQARGQASRVCGPRYCRLAGPGDPQRGTGKERDKARGAAGSRAAGKAPGQGGEGSRAAGRQWPDSGGDPDVAIRWRAVGCGGKRTGGDS